MTASKSTRSTSPRRRWRRTAPFNLDGLFGTRKLQLMGLDPEWVIRSIVQDRSDVTALGVTLTADTEAKVVITVGRR